MEKISLFLSIVFFVLSCSENNENDLTLKNINKKNDGGVNSLDFDKMNSNNIFHSSIIKKICVKYRLRFLDSELFKGEYPQNITKIIRGLENKHNTKLKNFMIMAPSKLFKIKSPWYIICF